MKQTYETGLLGENAAEEYLCREFGMTCLERRFRTKSAEIDLIMLDRDTIVFVEVKTRRSGTLGVGLMTVNAAKQKRIARGATLYLMNRHLLNRSVRFDVVEINREQIYYVPNAFQPGGMFFG